MTIHADVEDVVDVDGNMMMDGTVVTKASTIAPGLRVQVDWETFRDFTPWYDLPEPIDHYYIDGVYKKWANAEHTSISVYFAALKMEWVMDMTWVVNFGLQTNSLNRKRLTEDALKRYVRSAPKKVIAISNQQQKLDKIEQKRKLDEFLSKPKVSNTSNNSNSNSKRSKSVKSDGSSGVASQSKQTQSTPSLLKCPNIYSYVVSCDAT